MTEPQFPPDIEIPEELESHDLDDTDAVDDGDIFDSN